MSNKPNFSVIIPYYNMGRYIDDALASLFSQTLEDIEIILVNDGSTDTVSLDKLQELKLKYKDIVFIDQNNKGLPGARNSGVMQAKADYISCLDADDILEPTYLQKAKQIYDSSAEQIAIVSAWVQFFGQRQDIWQVIDFNYSAIFTTNPLQSATTFRKSAWERVRGYDETMTKGYEDWDFWLRIVANGNEWKTIPEVLIKYRSRGDSMVKSSDKSRYEIYRNMIKKNIKAADGHIPEILTAFLRRYDELAQSKVDYSSKNLFSKLFSKVL